MNNLSNQRFNLNFEPANTPEEYISLVSLKPERLIMSTTDFYSFYKKSTFLSFIDSKVIDNFAESLIFTNGGLGSAYYGELANVLTFNQFEELFANLGISLKLFCERANKVCSANPGLPLACRIKDGSYCLEQYCSKCVGE